MRIQCNSSINNAMLIVIQYTKAFENIIHTDIVHTVLLFIEAMVLVDVDLWI